MNKKQFIICRFDGEPHGGGASRSLAAVGGVQGFFSEYSLFLIVLFAAIVVVFVSIILALGVYICKARFFPKSSRILYGIADRFTAVLR